MSRLRKGDTVQVLSGKDRGKQGKILSMISTHGTAIVEGINLATHYERRGSGPNQAGGLIKKERAIRLDKLAIICPRCSRPSRIGWSVQQDAKQRVCKRCKDVING